MADETKTIWVKARPEMGDRNALWERDAAHPGGEVFVAGDEPVEVAQTPEVMARLAPRLQDGGTLVRLEGDALKQAQQAHQLRQQQTVAAREGAQAAASGDAQAAAKSDRRVEDLQRQVDALNAKVEAMVAPTPVATGEGGTSTQLAAGAKPAKPEGK
jgi:hypothetical protein